MSHFVPELDGLSMLGSQTHLLVWAIVFLGALTLWMIIEIIAIRVESAAAARRTATLTRIWEPVFFASAIDQATTKLPVLRRRDRAAVMAIWCRIGDYVSGDSHARLNEVARASGLERWAARMMTRRWHLLRAPSRVELLLAIRACERLRIEQAWARLTRIVSDGPAPLDRFAARALVALDPVRAAPVTLPILVRQGRWARHLVEDLVEAGAATAIEAYAALLTSAPDDAIPGIALLLDRCHDPSTVFAVRARLELVPGPHPEALAALLNTLSVVGGMQERQLVHRFVNHEQWFVRMRAAQALGRCGDQRDAATLTTLLGDSNWYTRYHAARAMLRIPAIGETALAHCAHSSGDRYARDMARHVIAETAAPAVR